jgi:hypothetical protein
MNLGRAARQECPALGDKTEPQHGLCGPRQGVRFHLNGRGRKGRSANSEALRPMRVAALNGLAFRTPQEAYATPLMPFGTSNFVRREDRILAARTAFLAVPTAWLVSVLRLRAEFREPRRTYQMAVKSNAAAFGATNAFLLDVRLGTSSCTSPII